MHRSILLSLLAAGCTSPLALPDPADGGALDAPPTDGSSSPSIAATCPGEGGEAFDLAAALALVDGASCGREVACGLLAADREGECLAHPYPFQTSTARRRDAILLDPARVGLDCAALADCTSGLGIAACRGPGSQVGACYRVLVGRVAAGGACTDDLHCAGGGWCDARPGCEGVCRPPLADGAPCDYAGRCAPGSTCATVCTPRGGLGAPCAPAGNDPLCAPGLFCIAFACAAPRPVGAPCALGDTCAAGSYCEGIECDGNQGQCAGMTGACTASREGGAACVDDLQCASGHCIGQFKDQAQPGTCGPPSPIGGPCTPDRVDCQLTLECDAATRACIPWVDPGGACALGGPWCAAGTWCASEGCAVVGEPGDACDGAHPCDGPYRCDHASGRCVPNCPPPPSWDGGCPEGGCA